MSTHCQPLPRSLVEEMLQVVARAICDRPTDNAAQRESRTRQMVHAVMGFEPRDGLEFILSTLAFGHFQLILDSMRDIFLGQTDAMKAKTRTTTVALDRAMLEMIREMRLARRRPLARSAENATEEEIGPADSSARAEPPPVPAPPMPAPWVPEPMVAGPAARSAVPPGPDDLSARAAPRAATPNASATPARPTSPPPTAAAAPAAQIVCTAPVEPRGTIAAAPAAAIPTPHNPQPLTEAEMRALERQFTRFQADLAAAVGVTSKAPARDAGSVEAAAIGD